MKAQLRKMFCKISMNTRATISVMLLCLFVYLERCLILRGDWKIGALENFPKIIGKHVCNFIKK